MRWDKEKDGRRVSRRIALGGGGNLRVDFVTLGVGPFMRSTTVKDHEESVTLVFTLLPYSVLLGFKRFT